MKDDNTNKYTDIDLNNLKPVIEDKDNTLINGNKKGGLYSSGDDKPISGYSGTGSKEVKLFSDITDNVSMKDSSGLSNNFSQLADNNENSTNNVVQSFVENKKDVKSDITERKSNRRSYLTSILLFVIALLQFIVIPFIFRTTNTSEGESIAYPYPILRYSLDIGFIVFFCFMCYNYKKKDKNLKRVLLNIIILLFMLYLFLINSFVAIVLLFIYIFILINVNLDNLIDKFLAEYVVSLFIMSFLSMAGGAAFWLLLIPPFCLFIPLFILSGFLCSSLILCGILFIVLCGISIFLIIRNGKSKE